MAPQGRAVGALLLLLGGTLTAAGVGWWRRRLWGWGLALGVVGVQAVGDLVNAFRRDVLGGSIGVAIASCLLVYLLRPRVRELFAGSMAPRPERGLGEVGDERKVAPP